MTETFTLLPHPQKLSLAREKVTLADEKLIALDVPDPAAFWLTAQYARRAIFLYAGKPWKVVGGAAVPEAQIGLLITLDESVEHEQGYRLTVTTERITLRARDAAGAFYGVMTLTQVLQQVGALPDLDLVAESGLQALQQRHVELPVLEIDDWPDLPRRGVMLDVSRDKVPRMKTLYALVDKLASWKINELQFNTEHTFAYQHHPDVWENASPMTAGQVLALDAYCKERFIDFVPNQNSFGHLHRWFEHPKYQPLAETEGNLMTPWGIHRDVPFSLAPANPDSLRFLEGLFDELLPNFTSAYFNVGCDETWDLGLGKSKELCERKGTERVYLEFLLEIYERVKARGRTMQFWADIVGNHPELIPELPRDAIALEWWYEADFDFGPKCKPYAEAGIPFYVCPGTSSWCSFAGRPDNAIANIRNAAENAVKYGAHGLLNTDWGDGGHWQTLPVSYLGFAYGAAVSWALAVNRDIDVPKVLDTFAFEDQAEVMGKLVRDLGNVYQLPGMNGAYGNVFFWAYFCPLDRDDRPDFYAYLKPLHQGLLDIDTAPGKIRAALEYIDSVMQALPNAQMQCADAELIQQEYELAADMLRHGARRLLIMHGDGSINKDDLAVELARIQERYETIWLARNRPGGLKDSLRRMRGERKYHE